MKWFACLMFVPAFCGLLSAQKLDLGPSEDFLAIVDPIMTQGEREIYAKLPNRDAKRYFQGIFWYKRDPEPQTVGNAFRLGFFERRQIAISQFGEGETPGHRTDRGRILLLMGDPEDVKQRKLSQTGLIQGYEEVWHYPSRNMSFRFLYDTRNNSYRLKAPEDLEAQLESVRLAYVLDRAEPYRLSSRALTLPYLGFTKDIENLASEDRQELRYNLSYAFFRGDQNRTQIMVNLTFADASRRGVDINLAAYDPYQHKVVDFKKRFDVVNYEMQRFSVVMEPDQYDIVLRLKDRDGRESVDRRRIDVPRLGGGGIGASSMLIASGLAQIPLEGFVTPKQFVFDNRYFPLQDNFTGVALARLFVFRRYYETEQVPPSRFVVNGTPVTGVVEATAASGDGLSVVYRLDGVSLRPGWNEVRGAWQRASGDWAADAVMLNSSTHVPEQAKAQPVSLLLQQAKEARDGAVDGVAMVLPGRDDAAALDRVVMRADGHTIHAMHVFLNDRLVLARYQDPWDVSVDQGLFSISGENNLTAVLETDRGLFKVTKELKPLKADEKIRTRLVEVFFNAYDEELKFKNDLDLSQLEVSVDGESTKPVRVEKLEEPITYCFLVDTSYSMKASYRSNIGALKRYIESMRPMDRGFFVAFSDRYDQYLEPNQSKAVLLSVADALKLQTPNPKQADKLYEENETYLYDAVIASIHSLLQYSGRKVMVVVSDGIGTEGEYSRNGMLSYARENDVVVYSLWLDNNPGLSDDETAFLQKETGKAEKFVRAIGLSRLFAKKDAKKNYISDKVRFSSINQGVMKILAEESGGFHYRIFRADRSKIREYVRDIEEAANTMYAMTLNLPVSVKTQEVRIDSPDESVNIRAKTHIKVRKTNPLLD
ncbi:GWxTD domain-containing protein [Acanthopleuribacter pedis]|uniref:GWxTD domain-containing protein n=1 Tax=Acanthopleuribacter pedis TaxID=442870 RepID=A0A8J7U500_9BACT|nr:GWxTD domain-containing protein [Acanthopleuribacter pedis]MBO1322008.1 GWxTD domain-containing protein [Acanthopleuribacter pedis]